MSTLRFSLASFSCRLSSQQQHHLLRMQQDNTSAISLSNHEHPKVKPAVSFRRTVQLHFRVTKQEIPNGYLGGHSHSNRDEAISLSEPQPLHTCKSGGRMFFPAATSKHSSYIFCTPNLPIRPWRDRIRVLEHHTFFPMQNSQTWIRWANRQY